MGKIEAKKLLSSVSNAAKILRAFTMEQPQKGVRELAAELGISKSNVQRVLATLASEGLVKKNEETNKYELGLSVLELSSIVLNHIELHNEAFPIVKKAANTFKETSHLAVLNNYEIIYLCKVEHEESIMIDSHSGGYNFPHCTSSGKLLLAFGEPSVVETVLQKELQKFTPRTITSPEKLKDELEDIRKKGYSISIGEYRSSITSISAPIKDHSGKITAAINIVGPNRRFSKVRIRYCANELIRYGELISERLGFWNR